MTPVSRENSKFWIRLYPQCVLSGDLRLFSIIEGTKESLQRLQLDYVDIIFAHRPDPSGKCLQIRPRNTCKQFWVSSDRGDRSGFQLRHRERLGSYFPPGVSPALVLIDLIKAFYWATSEWSAVEIEEAHREFNDSVLLLRTRISDQKLQMLPPSLV